MVHNKGENMTTSFKAIALTTLIATTTVYSMPVLAQQNSQPETLAEMPKEEKIGLSIGAIIGGILGGPPGAFITAIAGDFIGKSMVADDKIAKLEDDIDSKESQLAMETQHYQQKIQGLEEQHQQKISSIELAYQQSEQVKMDNLMLSLLFRTGSSEIEPQYQRQVLALAKVMTESPDLTIDLSGYTDKQGDELLNEQLASARVNSVKALLMENGIADHRIVSNSFGESVPIDKSSQDVNFFDRRVVMKFTKTNEEVASR